MERERLLAELAGALAALYESALRLPALPPLGDDLADDAPAARAQWQTVHERFRDLLGSDDLYWTAVPFGEDERRQLARSLADDLADVYLEVKQGLELMAAGEPQDEVVWEWRFSFWSHWGEHAIEALRCLHAHLAALGGPPGRGPWPRGE